MSFDLTRFDLATSQACSAAFRAAVDGADSIESAARAATRFFYESLTGADGQRACALVRCYKTHRFGALPDPLQRIAKRSYGRVAFSPPDPSMKCLVLLATTGDEPAWNDRRKSENHQAIPLPTPQIVERAPMIAQLVRQLGIDISQMLEPASNLVRNLPGRSYGVFHVERARGSSYIPAQRDFVEPYAIASVVGFGGVMSDGELAALILFSRITISADVADRLRSMSPDLQAAFTQLSAAPTFDDAAPVDG